MQLATVNLFFKKFFYLSKNFLLSPLPLRVELIRYLSRKFNLFDFLTQLDIESLEKPYLAYCMLNAAIQAKGLGIMKISAIEFGVCSGASLTYIEKYSKEIEKLTGVSFNTYGFDMMSGLPKTSIDYKNQLYFWPQGAFKTDLEKLRNNIKTSTLIIGDIKDKVKTFFDDYEPPVIGFISFDLDYYTSTLSAFEIFNFSQSNYLPRVECYMDDVSSFNELSASKGTGVLRAIEEFNERENNKKIYKKELVSQFRRFKEYWNEKIYVFHYFNHDLYNKYLGSKHI
tara:strand:- start:446 stop:1297 length:852 start_codon:yes stop_codon:yes gene_type:complete